MKSTRNLPIFLILTAILLPLAGCGEGLPPGMPTPVPCEVIVTQEGKPFEGAVVRLLPQDGSQWDSTGRTDTAGKATFYTMDKYKGVVPGKYKVAVSKIETDESSGKALSSSEALGKDTSLASFQLVEEKYTMASTTTLEIEVNKETPSHTVEVGKAVRIKIDDRR